MNLKNWIFVFAACWLPNVGVAQEDPGKTNIGRVCVTVFYATNADPKSAGEKALPVTPEMVSRLNGEERLRFKNYRLLGKDTQPLLRSYESWAEPLKPSDEVMVRFEAQGKPSEKAALLDLELWIGRKKIVKTDARLEGDRPLLLLGPEWRGGRLIIAVSLDTVQKPSS